MNASEKKRMNAIVKNLKVKGKDWKMVFGMQSFTAKQLIKELGNNKKTRHMLLEALDSYVIAEMQRDAARRQ